MIYGYQLHGTIYGVGVSKDLQAKSKISLLRRVREYKKAHNVVETGHIMYSFSGATMDDRYRWECYTVIRRHNAKAFFERWAAQQPHTGDESIDRAAYLTRDNRRREALGEARAEVERLVLAHLDALATDDNDGAHACALAKLHGRISTEAWRNLYRLYINE